MSKFYLQTVTAVALASFAAPAFAASDSANGSVNILQPISISKSTDLQFGTVVRPTSGNGSVSIDATTGARTVGSGAVAVTSTTGRATFAVSGTASSSFSTTVPPNFDMTGPGSTIPVTLTSTAPTALSGSGTATVGVGGSFSLPFDQVDGAYSGSFTVSVAYN